MLQQDVSNQLTSMGVAHLVEQRTEDGYFSLDIVVPHLKVAIEVDGPYHYLLNWPPSPTGATLLRRRLLRAQGWRMVSVPYFLWSYSSPEEQQLLLRERLLAVGVPEAYLRVRNTYSS